jgi:hypothetical protein
MNRRLTPTFIRGPAQGGVLHLITELPVQWRK